MTKETNRCYRYLSTVSFKIATKNDLSSFFWLRFREEFPTGSSSFLYRYREEELTVPKNIVKGSQHDLISRKS